MSRLLIFIFFVLSCANQPHHVKGWTIAECNETCETQRDVCYMTHDDVTDCGAEFKDCTKACQ